MSLTQSSLSDNRPHRGLTDYTLSNSKVASTCLYNTSTSQFEIDSSKNISQNLGTPSTRILQENFYRTSGVSNRQTDEIIATGHGIQFGKDLRVLTGYDVTSTEKEFDALPISIRKKYFSTLERLRFAQGTRAAANKNGHVQDKFQQNSHTLRSCHTTYSSNKQNQLYSKLDSSPPRISSLAERRGKRLDYLNTHEMHLIEQSHQNYNPKSTSSVQSYQKSLLDPVNSKPLKRDNQANLTSQYPRNVFDNSGRLTYKESPTSSSYSLLPENPDSSLSDISNLSSHITSLVDKEARSGPKSQNRTALIAYTTDQAGSTKNEKHSHRDFSLDNYRANLDGVILQAGNYSKRTSFRQQISIKSPRNNRISISSPQSLNFEIIPTPSVKSRSRTPSLVNSIKTTKTSKSILNDNDLNNKETINSRNDSRQQSQNAMSSGKISGPPATKPKSAPILVKSNFESKYDKKNNSVSNSKMVPLSAGLSKESYQLLSLHDDKIQNISSSQRRRSYTTSSLGNSRILHNSVQPATARPIILKKIDSPLSSGTNQMTLRMTLTRPDLRMDEDEIYAWQDSKISSQNQYLTDFSDRIFEAKGPLGGPDGWELEEKESGVVKRLWNKVTHNLKLPVD